MTVTRRSQPPSSPSCWDSDDSDAFPRSTPRASSLLPEEPRTPPPFPPFTTSPVHQLRTPSPPRSSSPTPSGFDPIRIDTPTTSTSVAQRNPSPLGTSLSDLPSIPRVSPPLNVTSQRRQAIRQSYRSDRSRPTLLPIDDRSAHAIARVPRQREIQQQRRRVPLSERISKGRRCSTCNVYCPTKSHYLQHIRTRAHQRAQFLRPYPCNICSFTAFSREDYQRHINGKRHLLKANLSPNNILKKKKKKKKKKQKQKISKILFLLLYIQF